MIREIIVNDFSPDFLCCLCRAVRRGIQPPDHLFQIRSPPQSISSQPLPTRTDRSNRCVPPSSSHSESRIEILSLESIPVSHPVSGRILTFSLFKSWPIFFLVFSLPLFRLFLLLNSTSLICISRIYVHER